MYRLGNFKRNRRDYSIDQRAAGKTVSERIHELQFTKLKRETEEIGIISWILERRKLKREREFAAQMNLPFVTAKPVQKRNSFRLLSLSLMYKELVEEICTPHLIDIPVIDRFDVTYDHFAEYQFETLFGFTKPEVMSMVVELPVPEYFYLIDNEVIIYVLKL